MDEIPLWTLILQIIIIALNALLSLLDVSVEALTDGRVKKLAEDGDQDAINMLHINNIEKKFPAAIMFTSALLNTAGLIFVTRPLVVSLVRYISSDWIPALRILTTAVIIFVFVLISLLLGTLIPRYAAQARYSEKDIKLQRTSAFRLYKLTKPVVCLLTAVAGSIAKAGAKETEAAPEITEDEIMLMVDAVEESGAIESAEKQMIENVFNFSTTTASMVMTHRTKVISIPIDAEAHEIQDIVINAGKSRFPVYEDDIDHIVGILMARDYFVNLHAENPKPIAELLRKPYIVPGSIRTNMLFENMQRTNTHIAVVVDEYGGTAGIVTLEDLLEELVGNIYDESDMNTEQTDIVKLEENVWRVAGDVELAMLEEALDIDLPEDEDYDTVGGMALSKLTAIPDDGEHPEVFVNGLYIYVEETKERRIQWVKISQVMTVEEYTEDSED